jgi:hypothetical protein
MRIGKPAVLLIAALLGGCADAPSVLAGNTPAQHTIPLTCQQERKEMMQRSVFTKISNGQDELSATLETQDMMDQYSSRHPCPN